MDILKHVQPHVLLERASGAGSARGQNKSEGSSISALVSTFAPTIIISGVIFLAFLILQKKLERVYGPRTYLGSMRNWQRSPKQTAGLLGWRREYNELKDEFVLGHSSLDNYLWLRFFKMLVTMSFVGCIITWPVLFPVNATGGKGKTGLDILSMANVQSGPRYYAEALVAWVFLGFVMFLITRELRFYVRIRQQYYLSPYERSRISNRSIVFVNVPEEARNEQYLRSQFAGVVKVWLVNVPDQLQDDVDERDKAATKLETGEVKYITNHVTRNMKAQKKNKEGGFDQKDRPQHRLPVLKFLPLGKKVDTIDWSRGELKRLVPQVAQEQNQHRNDTSSPQAACFIEFESVHAAHEAFLQCSQKTKNAIKMTPKELGVAPEDVLWKNIIKPFWKVKLFSAVSTSFVWFLCIFWTIPVAVIGAISNINKLEMIVPFLSFIEAIPKVVLGVVTGLLPVVLMAVLFILVPIVMMILAKMFEPTLPAAHLKVQGWYFPFQVIQLFIVTTLSSGAASAVQTIFNNPAKAPGLLSEALPTASNFYINYFILQGLMTAALQFLNIAPLLFVLFLGKVLDKTPRKLYNRYVNLGGLGWGPLYPKFTNLGVIALAYSSIAPLVLGFATVGFYVMYLGFRYNALFTIGTVVSTRGRSFERALKQLTTGIYISEICLIGLFGIGSGSNLQSLGPLILMVVFLIATIVWQVWLGRSLKKLENDLPAESMVDQAEKNGHMGLDVEQHPGANNGGPPKGIDQYAPGEKVLPQETNASKVGLMGRIKSFFAPTQAAHDQVFKISPHLSSPVRAYTQQEHNEAFMHPAVTSECPSVWIARDNDGLSRQEVDASRRTVGEGFEMTDEGAWYNDKGKIEFHHEDPKDAPIWEDEPVY